MTSPAGAPHTRPVTPVTVKRGSFFIPGDVVESAFGTVQRGPMFVEWESPVEPTQALPVILVHGGGGQSTDFTTTPDGRPGWRDLLVDAGFVVYTVDRPGHGRSAGHPAVLGELSGQGGYEVASMLFAQPADHHDRWPWGDRPGDAIMDQFVASMMPMRSDVAESQRIDGIRLAQLLDQTGAATIITHSAGAPGGWLATNQRPGLVHSIAAIEPMGPPFATLPGFGALTWGLTQAPLITEPQTSEPSTIGAGGGPAVPGFDIPIAVFSGSASRLAQAAEPTVEFLAALGARAQSIPLAGAGISGNGHGLIFESNSADTIVPVIDWIMKVQR